MRTAITFLVIAWTFLAQAQALRISGKGSVGGQLGIMSLNPNLTCQTMAYTNGAAQVDSDDTSTASFMGQFQIVFSSSTNVCSITFNSTLANGVNFRASVWTTDAGNNLLAQQGSYSSSVTGNGSQQNNTFTFASSVSLSASTQYAFVFGKTDNTALSLATLNWRSTSADSSFSGRWLAAGTVENLSSEDSLMSIHTP